jgi:pimeloyl-ACP methyl ester carboxylesterase
MILTSTRLFRAATALIVLHIVDAELLQTRPGVSAGDHVLATVLPVAVAVVGAVLYPRLRPGLQAGMALCFGILALVEAGIAAGGGISGSDVTGVLLVAAGLALIGVAVYVPWRERGRRAASRRRRWVNRAVAVGAGAVVLLFGVVPVALALWTTGKFSKPIGTFSVPHRDVGFTTSDGLRLSGWYVPSKNGAAVLIVHGGGGDRGGARLHAAMLARAGYGVLLYDARGRGRSEGDPDAYGWTWGPDVDAAATWLEHQAGVRRVGALGLSTGADVLIAAASRRRDIRAIVADGATTESLDDVSRTSHGGDLLAVPFFAVQYAAAEVFEGHRQLPPLAELAARVPPTPILFVASSWKIEREAAPVYAHAAAASSSLWLVDAGHTQGLRTRPVEYRRRVVGFFDRELLAAAEPVRGLRSGGAVNASPAGP